ncbi:ROK family transcriptional regulator [Actinospica sp.]|uniref:ROK family transcriptional regulator n=1 Tax=Actinospica sp. TaxID=1872142 RepID=UPI002C7BCE1A|nr:ROK family transcriptional regulator [Actinospica sp.]HWG23981.1 ROK family transcriptional regulator [Actinospica sp.]
MDSEVPWNRQRLRSNNERLLLEQLRTVGPTSRAQLARDTGLSKPTVSHALAALEEHGLVRAAGRIAAERGRTALLYESDPTAGYVLGIDIGRARLRAAVADLSGEILARTDVPNQGRTANAVADAAARAAGQALRAADVPATSVIHAAVGTPGVFDPEDGRVRYAANLPGWGRSGLFGRIRERLGGIEISVHNDANLAALGEYDFGAGRDSRLFVYVLIGTGLGVGIVANGELFTGAHGAAGEVGFLPVSFSAPGFGDAADPHPGGELEEAVSADAVVRAARERGLKGRLTAKRVFDEARAGHPAAVAAVHQEGERIAHVVAAISAVIDPDVVVLGGGVGHSADLMLDPVREVLHRSTPLRPLLSASELGDDAVLLGALTTALRVGRPQVFDRRTGK